VSESRKHISTEAGLVDVAAFIAGLAIVNKQSSAALSLTVHLSSFRRIAKDDAVC
jgi:hypothetical protein